MNIFQSKFKDLKRSSPVSLGKRFISFLIDFFFLFVLSAIAFEISVKVVQDGSSYRAIEDSIQQEIEYYDTYIGKSGLKPTYPDISEELARQNKMCEEYLFRGIYSAYLTNTEYTFENWDDHKAEVMSYGELTDQNDLVTNFYKNFLPNNDVGIQIDYPASSGLEKAFGIYRAELLTNSSLYVFKEENGVPMFTSYTAYCIYHYKYINRDDNVGTNGKNYLDTIQNTYLVLIGDGLDFMSKAEPYYSNHWIPYTKLVAKQSLIVNGTMLVSLFACSLLVYVLPKFLFKDEKTFARKLLSLGTISIYNSKTAIWKQIIRTIVEILMAPMLILLMYILPPFNFDFRAMIMPMNIDTKFSLIVIVIACYIFFIASGCFAFFTHDRQTLIDVLTRTKVVDSKHRDEVDSDDDYEASPN